MNEAEWLSCTHTWKMLDYLCNKVSERRFRLIACAVARLNCKLFGTALAAVELAEDLADGKVGREEVQRFRSRQLMDWETLKDSAVESAWWAFRRPSDPTVSCDLVREIVGNPFRPTVIAVSVLVWAGGTAVKLAQAIYDDRAFDRLPILADALEDAGCSDAVILDHCRSAGPHVRGCWAVDLLLAKG